MEPDYKDQLVSVENLCKLLGISLSEGLKELEVILKERQDFVAIPHPTWRNSNIDGCLQRMQTIYGDPDRAYEKFEAMRGFYQRNGKRVENIAARNSWRNIQFDKLSEPRCPYCNVALTTKNTEVDHKIPLARGGKDDRSNWQLVCSLCNRGKSDLVEDRFFLRWKPKTLYKQLVLSGKTSITPPERFELLSREEFNCKYCQAKSRTGVLRICFKVAPDEGGQAIPENLTVVCDNHVQINGLIECKNE